jgi:hypothetical protein
MADQSGFSYVKDYEGIHFGVSCHAGSKGRAKSKLRAGLLQEVQEAVKTAQNVNRRLIGCKDGTVLVVEYRYGSWGYSSWGPGRNHASACGLGADGTYEKALEAARKHAQDGYGGIAWEHS